MAWTRPPSELVALFERLRPPTGAGVEHRSMFGYPCAFCGGNMFAGLHEASLVLRLGPEDREAFLALPGARLFEPMPGRAMKEYVRVPEALLADEPVLRGWMERSLACARALPPKRARSKR